MVAAARKEKAARPRSTGARETPGLSDSRLLGDDDLDRCGVSGSGTEAVRSVVCIGYDSRCRDRREARSGEGEVVRAGAGDAGWIV